MSVARSLLVLLLCSGGCAKRTPPVPVDAAADILAAWTRQQLDLRTWRSCSRSAAGMDPEIAVVVYPIAADGSVGTVSLVPEELAHDPAMICLQLELSDPPAIVPHQGVEREIRLELKDLHEIPVAPEG